MRKGTNLRQINYNTASLRFSDHRPVYATFQCIVSIVDEACREALSREIYERRRAQLDGASANNPNEDSDDEDLIGYDSIEPGLPPASSDTRKWWLDNGQPARSTIQPPQKGHVLNPNRPSNPYTPTDEPDWVTVPRQQSTTKVAPPPPDPRLSRSQTTNGTRKLPPAFIGSTSVSGITQSLAQQSLVDSSTSGQVSRDRSQSNTTNRRLSTSTTSSVAKKAAPPVARKPIHLVSSPSLTSSPTLSTVSSASTSRPERTPQKIRSTVVDHTGFAPPPRRTTDARSTVGAGYGRSDNDDKSTARDYSDPPPPPQPRRPGAAKIGDVNIANGSGPHDEGRRPMLPPRKATGDLLGSDEGIQIEGWETLRPN